MKFSLDGFKNAVQKGVFLPSSFAYGYVDEAKYEHYQHQLKWTERHVAETFEELKRRMSRCYYNNIVLAQTCALDYAALQFPAYSMLITEDLAEDWLAIVDFHKKHARDHSIHQPLTAYIDASLLGFGESNDSLAITATPGNLLDFCVDVVFKSKEAAYIREAAKQHGMPQKMIDDNKASREFWKGLFYKTVVLSALFHDIGYPWQFVDRIGSDLKKNASILHPIDTAVSNIIEHFKDRMVMLPLRHYRTDFGNEPVNESDELQKITTEAMKTHGFPGAIAFLSLNDAIRKYPSGQPLSMIQEFKVEWAAMGIFMHDMEGKHRELFPKLKVNVSQDPLSAIVSLADYLEEFNRPKVSFTSKKKESRMKYYSDCSVVDVNTDADGILTVKMKYANKTGKAIATAFKKRETSEYFDPGNGFVDLAPLGIKRVVYEQV